MSTRKNAAKMSGNTKKVVSGTTKQSSKERDASTERKEKLELQSSQKNKSKLIANPKIKSVIKTDSASTIDTKLASNKKLKNKQEVPITPSSSRVTTSQYFPSRNMFSNALKTKDINLKKPSEEPNNKQIPKIMKSKTSLDKTKPIEKSTGRLVKPTKTNIIKKSVSEKVKTDYPSLEAGRSSPDSSTVFERPRTATLRKGSIVNANIAGPDYPKIPLKSKVDVPETKIHSPKSLSSEDDKYEDDFESYESDFEEYSSSNSTGNFEDISSEDTSSSSRRLKCSGTTSVETRIVSMNVEEDKKLDSGHFDMSDYKNKRILNNIKESIEKENTNLVLTNNPASLSDEGFEDQKSLQFINFLEAKKKNERLKSLENKRKRGEDILNMIRLDSFGFTLFEMAPVSYETFIKRFGNDNAIQTACQTGENDIDEEIQTDDIIRSNKWTQQPTSITNFDQSVPKFWQQYRSEYLGCGSGDDIIEDDKNIKNVDRHSLNKFLLSSCNLMLRLLQESITNNNTMVLRTNNKTLPFSDGYYKFETSRDIFVNTRVSYATFSCDISTKLITVFTKNRNSVVAVWSVFNCEEPEAVFETYGFVTCCSFGTGKSEIVYMGMEDGSILIWNIRDKKKSDILKTVPTFSTDISSSHQTKIVALHILDNYEENSYNQQTNELCSLDEDGEIILWTIIEKRTDFNNSDENDVVLVKNTNVSLKSLHPDLTDLQCTDFVASSSNTNYLLVSTNYGFIIHHLIKGGSSTVKKFLPGSDSIATCLESCPFSSEYFLAGYDNGDINIYSRSSEKPLMVLSDKDKNLDYCPVDKIQWSKNVPVVVYTKDAKNRLNIWYLNESDMFPIYTVPFDEDITCLKLSPCIQNKKSFLLIGTSNGSLYLYQLNEEHGQQLSNVYEESVETFKKYVNRL
ncbi:cytoplasmic dynein 2 intermediate chain 1 isoform X1 [Diorhabda sublineata]|uniref:cytoplasmic dynein 2 intermediate chain 1 isoform X1 n=2 Tax=Diorhabda sublineata TaxID=1163346 RepID=UPI0024E10509|nr:cytoplasmic dynein 2 intermediate chain 1 isoform X1 [Diorhabda sublineata]